LNNLGEILVSTSDAPYTLEKTRGYVVLCLLPKLNEVQWGDVQQVGNEIIPDLDALRSPALLVDLSALDYMGSSMVALLVRLWKAVQKKNGRMVVQSEQKMVTEVLNIAGLNSLWDVVPTRDEAIGAMRHAPLASPDGAAQASWTGPILSLIAAATAGWVWWTTRSGDPLFNDAKQSVYLLFALAAVAIIISGLTLFRNAGAARIVGGLILLASLAVGVGGFQQLSAAKAAPPVADSKAAADGGDAAQTGAVVQDRKKPLKINFGDKDKKDKD
jgi:anti-anti-sigma factor